MNLKFISIIIFIGVCSNVFCQKKYFNGIINFATTTKANSDKYDAKDFMLLNLDAKESKVYHGNSTYKFINQYKTEYLNKQTLKCFTSFKDIDSVYEIKQSEYTDQLKLTEKEFPYYDKIKERVIEVYSLDTAYFGYKCIKEQKVYYNDTITSIYLDSNDYYFANSIILYRKKSTKYYTTITQAISINSEIIVDSSISFPNLPLGKDIDNAFLKDTYYKNDGHKSWMKYLVKNLNADVCTKCIDIPKGKKFGTATVMVQFIINKEGNISDAYAMNEEFVHLKFILDAIKVISNSKRWIPSKYKDENIISVKIQPITYQVYAD